MGQWDNGAMGQWGNGAMGQWGNGTMGQVQGSRPCRSELRSPAQARQYQVEKQQNKQSGNRGKLCGFAKERTMQQGSVIKTRVSQFVALFLVAVSIFMVACGNKQDKADDGLVKNVKITTTVQDAVSYGKNILSWDKVSGVDGYSIKASEYQFFETTDTSFDLGELQLGDYQLQVAGYHKDDSDVGYRANEYSKPIPYQSYGRVTTASTGGTTRSDSGLFGAMDEVSVGSSYLGRGFDMINSNLVNRKTVLRTPIFDGNKLKAQPVVKDVEYATKVIDTYNESATQFLEDLNGKLNLSANGYWGSASMSSTFGTTSESKEFHSFKMLDAYVHSYTLSLQSDIPVLRDIVTNDFFADLYSKQVSPAQLMEKYGTHFVMGVDMGGRLQSTYLLESNEQSSIDSVSASISTQFNYGVGGGSVGGEVDWRKEASSKGVTHNTEIWVLGGDSRAEDGTIFDFSSDDKVRDYYAQWADTLRYAPALMGLGSSQDIIPLWALIDGLNDKPEYSWTYQDGTSVNSLTRSAQLQEYFYQYGRESYVRFMNGYGKDVSLPKSITNVTVNRQSTTVDTETGRNVFYVRPELGANESLDINFDVLPTNASFFDKEYSVQPHDGDYLTVSKDGVINLADNAEQHLGDIVQVIVSAGGVRQMVSLKVDKVYDITYDAGEGDFGKDPYGVPIQQLVEKVHYTESIQSPSKDNRGRPTQEPKKEGFVHDSLKNLREDEKQEMGNVGVNYFDGWVDQQGKEFEFGYQPNRDITLFPKWRTEFFEITFDAGDGQFEHNGSILSEQTVKYRYNERPKSLSLLGRDDPVMPGLDDNGERLALFDSWYTTKNNLGKFDFETNYLTKDETVYAQYIQYKYFVVEFDLGGGIGNATTGRQNVDVSFGAEGKVVKPAKDPVKEYYTFKGWYRYGVAESGEDPNDWYPWNFETSLVRRNTILYALYDEPQNNLVTINLVDEDGKTVAKDWKLWLIPSGQKVPYQTDAVYPDYRLLGWYTTLFGSEKFSFDTIVTSELVIYGRMESAKYVVNFDLNGGNGDIPSQNLFGGDRVKEPVAPEADYRDFVRWTTDRGGNQSFNFDSVPTTNLTLYAQWKLRDKEDGAGEVGVRSETWKASHDNQTWGESNAFDTVPYSKFGLDKKRLQSLGYTHMQIFVTLNVAEESDGYEYINLYKTANASGAPYQQIKFEHGAGYKEPGWYKHGFTFAAETLDRFDDNSFVLRYGSSGALQNRWFHKDLYIAVVFTKR
ncbi:MAG: InlB B-repeat-containing protein [Firmicutes bacterium]|nr:InlB B-repeat-containing protein [Bacillota bacterium]